MGLVEGFAGVDYILGDLVATLALLCSLWITGVAFINIGSDMPTDAPSRIYVAWIAAVIFCVAGQIAIITAGLQQSVSGILGLQPGYTMITIGVSIGLFVLSRLIRKDRYASLL